PDGRRGMIRIWPLSSPAGPGVARPTTGRPRRRPSAGGRVRNRAETNKRQRLEIRMSGFLRYFRLAEEGERPWAWEPYVVPWLSRRQRRRRLGQGRGDDLAKPGQGDGFG